MSYPPPPGPDYPGSGAPPPYSPPPAPPGPGYPPPGSGDPYGPRRTNGLAIGAFFTGLFGCFGILGLILGAISLRQIADRGDKGRGFAIAGILLSVLWMASAGAFFAFGVNSDTFSGASKEPGRVDVRKMQVGDCINDSHEITPGETTEVSSVKIVPCNLAHDGEVLTSFPVTSDARPSDEQLTQLAESGCEERATKIVRNDPAAESFGLTYYYPTSGSWKLGDRMITCVVVSATDGKKLNRPVKKS